MEKRKVLKIHAALCDARKVTESTLAAYDRVEIHAANLLAGREARALLGRHSVEIKAGHVLDVEEDVRVSTVNGVMNMVPGQAVPEGGVYLQINGELNIAPGSEEVLSRYVGISVNGAVTCPESLVPLLSGATVNGAIKTYPDGCIRLKSTEVLDRTFHLRTKQDGFYYAASRIVALAEDIAFEKLAAKNVRFASKRLLVAESLAETAVPLFDDRTEIVILPDHCQFLNDDAELDESLLRKYGDKLYLNGSLTVHRSGFPLLEKFSFLRVRGDLLVEKGLEDAAGLVELESGCMRVIGGTILRDRSKLTVTREILEQAESGLSILDCAHVRFDEDVPETLIRERLVGIADCAAIICTEAQRAVIEPMSADVASFDDGGKTGAAGESEEDVSRISTAIYVL